jgi:hypothetical protein
MPPPPTTRLLPWPAPVGPPPSLPLWPPLPPPLSSPSSPSARPSPHGEERRQGEACWWQIRGRRRIPCAAATNLTAASLSSSPRCDLELSSPYATSSFADPSVEAAASTAVGVRRFGAGGNRRRQSEEIRRLRRPRLLGHAGGLRLSEEMVGPSLSQFSVISLLSVSSRRWLLWWWWWWWSWAAAGGGAAAADGGGWCWCWRVVLVVGCGGAGGLVVAAAVVATTAEVRRWWATTYGRWARV